MSLFNKSSNDVNFFKLDGEDIQKFTTLKQFKKQLDTSKHIHSCEFTPKTWPDDCHKVEGVIFENVSLSKKIIEEVTFQNCNFRDCLFIGTEFKSVSFHKCNFKNCNFWKASIDRCYWDPNTVKYDSIYFKKFSNIGVSTYQALMKNADNEDQPDHKKDADIQFRKWKRAQLTYDRKHGKFGWFGFCLRFLSSWCFEILCGFGYKPVRFGFWTIGIFLLISCLNLVILPSGISVAGNTVESMGYVDSVYYTFSILTSLGFSDVIPITSWAKIMTVTQAFFGIIWIGLFTSVVIKRILV